MNILIVFATTEGQTGKIARRAAGHVSRKAHHVDVIDSEEPGALPDWENYDAVILAGSVHQERHQDSLINFVIAHREQFNSLPSALISVSLSAATDDGRPAAQKYVERFLWITKLQPVRTLLLAGALRYSQYEYFKVEIVKHIVSKTAGTFEQTGDHEFTDWNALSQFLDKFLDQVAQSRASRAE
ncbi:MAG: hypothetical protein APF80_01535 [Alphaproteobacteria bacterium BRH_c36]|nr:MAG: hypothetical protein APF80_01535 [Alphaproteobacteria bacterium BRH_c36]